MHILGLSLSSPLENPSTIWAFMTTTITLAIFAFIAFAHWLDARRKEREAYYKAEAIRRIAEMPGESAKIALDHLVGKEESASREIKKLANMRLAGLINIGIGIALAIFMTTVGAHTVAAVGLFPGLTGVSLLIYSLFLAPKP